MEGFRIAFEIWRAVWWIVLPIGLGIIFSHVWLFYIRTLHMNQWRWVTLRIRTPVDLQKSPHSMEQVFSAFYSTFSHGFRLSEVYWDGLVEPWIACEIAGSSGGVAFYIHAQERHRNLVEGAVYAQYPDAEVEAVEDYTELLPAVLPNRSYELWGGDYALSKDSAYPLRTYVAWETIVLEEKIDTMAALLEMMSRLREGEHFWFQILIRPTDGRWKDEGEKLKNALAARQKPEKEKKALFPGWMGNFIYFIFQFVGNTAGVLMGRPPVWEESEEKEEKEERARLTPGEQEVLRGVEGKISKLGFECNMRWLYLARRDVFRIGEIGSSLTSVFRQFNTQNMNALRFYRPSLTIARPPFRNTRLYYKKRRMYDVYRRRAFWPGTPPRQRMRGALPGKFFILNVEELASLYHFPTQIVEAPLLGRVETRKGGPPGGLPIE